MKKQHLTKTLIKTLLPLTGCMILVLSSVACSLEIKPDPEVDTTITILYDPNGGTIEGSGEPKPFATKKGVIWKDVIKPEAVKPGFIVDYWMDTDGKKIEDDAVFNDSTTVVAHWIDDPSMKYYIKYNVDSSLDEEITWGSDIQWVEKHSRFITANSPVVSRENYIFNGWSSQRGGAPIDPSSYVDDNLNVYPLWTPETSEQSMIVAHLSDGDYVCDIDTLCSPDLTTQIHITKINDPATTHDYDRNVFNFPLTIGGDILYLPDYFLYSCTSFNQLIDFAANSKLTYIGQSFMAECSNFNQQILLPNTLRCIYNDFMGGCTEFNNGSPITTNPFTIPNNIQVIGQDFFNNCESFNHDITISENINFLGLNCMFNCKGFTSTLFVNTPIENIEYGTGSAWAANSSSAAIYATGFTVDGDDSENVALFKLTYPTIHGTDFWRKIND